MFIVLERFPNYTGHVLHSAFWQDFICVIRVPPQGAVCERQSHRRIFGELISNCAHICYTKELFPNYLCHHLGPLSADCKRGQRKGATSKNVKNRQKVSKSVKILFPWKLKPGFINRVLVAVIFEASKCL